MNPAQQADRIAPPNPREREPDGIARRAVRGFRASSFASIRRLAAIATVRAVIMHKTIKRILPAVSDPGNIRPASTALRIAHGIANTVWAILISPANKRSRPA